MRPPAFETLRTRTRALLPFMGLSAGSVLFEISALYAWVQHHYALAGFYHLLALGVSGGFLIAQALRHQSFYWPGLTFLLVACAGPFGALAAFFSQLLTWQVNRGVHFKNRVVDLARVEKKEELGAEIHERILAGGEEITSATDLEPFGDLLAFGNLSQKQAVLEKIARYYHPAFAPLLRKALQDEEAAVRVSAATALARLERDYMRRFMWEQKKYEEAPEDDRCIRRFATYCETYAGWGLMDRFNERHYRHKAITLYEKLAREDESVNVILGQLHGRMEDYDRARSCFEKCMGPGKPVTTGIVLAYAEILYYLQDFAALRMLSARYPSLFQQAKTEPGRATLSLLRQWTENPARRAA